MFNAKFPQKILAFKEIRANFLATHCYLYFSQQWKVSEPYNAEYRRNAVKRRWLSHAFESKNVCTWFENAVGCGTAMHVSWRKWKWEWEWATIILRSVTPGHWKVLLVNLYIILYYISTIKTQKAGEHLRINMVFKQMVVRYNDSCLVVHIIVQFFGVLSSNPWH